MINKIRLGQYMFTFQIKPSEARGNYVYIHYRDVNSKLGDIIEIKHENIKEAILPYTADFNAEYTLMDLDTELFDYLKDYDLYNTLKDWLISNYIQTICKEVVEDAEENN